MADLVRCGIAAKGPTTLLVDRERREAFNYRFRSSKGLFAFDADRISGQTSRARAVSAIICDETFCIRRGLRFRSAWNSDRDLCCIDEALHVE